MASEAEILRELGVLTQVYLKEPNDTQIQLFVENLKPFDAVLIQAAVREWVQVSKWFPTIAELYAGCVLEEGKNLERPDDPLMKAYFELQQEWYQKSWLEKEKWEQLAGQFQQKGRYYMADQVLEKFRQIEKLEEKMVELVLDQ